jgi:hypothetical protein
LCAEGKEREVCKEKGKTSKAREELGKGEREVDKGTTQRMKSVTVQAHVSRQGKRRAGRAIEGVHNGKEGQRKGMRRGEGTEEGTVEGTGRGDF